MLLRNITEIISNKRVLDTVLYPFWRETFKNTYYMSLRNLSGATDLFGLEPPLLQKFYKSLLLKQAACVLERMIVIRQQ